MAANLIDTPAKRAKLVEAKKPYFQKVDRGIYLGYRKQPKARKWVVRYLDPHATNPKNPYRIEAFADADDEINAGVEALDYKTAKRRAEDIAVAAQKVDQAPVAVTVATAVTDYVAMRDRREGGARSDAHTRLKKYVLDNDEIAGVPLRELTATKLASWSTDIKFNAISTKRRLFNDLRAALRTGWEKYRKMLPADWRDEVTIGLRIEEADEEIGREIQVLTNEQIRDVMNAARTVDAEQGWEGDLYKMIVALAATGMRFSQVSRLTVADAQVQSRKGQLDHVLMVPVSRKGGRNASKTLSRIKRLIASDDFRLLRPESDNRSLDMPLLERWRSRQVGYDKATGLSVWERDARGAWQSASEITRPWAVIREIAKLPAGTVPYAFRHTSMVNQLKQGWPVALVASLHNTSPAMIQKHYAAYIVDAMDDLVASGVRGVAA